MCCVLFVPVLKARGTELNVVKKMSFCFSDNIIPMIEIINDITDLDTLSEKIDNKKVFVDFLRITTDKYGNRYDPSKVILSLRISRDVNSYIRCLEYLLKYDNFIPVISINHGFEISEPDLIKIYDFLSLNGRNVALRIVPSLINKYEFFIQKKLIKKDYLLFDIGESSILSREMEIEDLSSMNIIAKKIIINSPRQARLTNGEFEENDISLLIDNRVAHDYRNYGFEGFGDYCGYKDVLPREKGSKGEGAAIALIYDYKINSFYSFVEKNTKLGVGGYNKVVNDIIQKKDIISDYDTCIAMKEVERINTTPKKGNWRTWIEITIIRYIYQMFLHLH